MIAPILTFAYPASKIVSMVMILPTVSRHNLSKHTRIILSLRPSVLLGVEFVMKPFVTTAMK
jgi:flagellar biosynthesis protein FliR